MAGEPNAVESDLPAADLVKQLQRLRQSPVRIQIVAIFSRPMLTSYHKVQSWAIFGLNWRLVKKIYLAPGGGGQSRFLSWPKI